MQPIEMFLIAQVVIALLLALFFQSVYRRTHRALRSSEDKFSKAFRASPDWITLSRLEDGRYIEVNDRFLRTTGYARGEVIGRTSLELGLWADPADRDQLLRTLREFGRASEMALTFRTKAGELRDCLASAEVLILDGEECILGVVRDNTERKRLEDQLRQAHKMEAVGQLAGGVAHDFNNLLMVVRGYTDLLLDRLPADSPDRRCAEQICKASDRASSLIGQLLAFSRRQVLQPRVLDLNVVLMELGKMLPRLVREDIELAIVPAPALWRVKADPNQLEQVILNLVVNARDAMPRGGNLTIETANVTLAAGDAELHGRMSPGPYVMLAVRDTGIGMDAQTMSRVFEPFFTTKEHGKGTGLGLASAYGIVKQSGGYIWVVSEPGKGATFTIYLPPAVEADPSAVEPRIEGRIPSGAETVLLVEDEEAVLELAHEFLRGGGYTVLTARGPAEAMHIAQNHPGRIHALVADVVLPGTSGRALAGRLTALRPQMRVLYVSGHAEEAVVHHGVLSAGAAFLEKPFTRKTLLCKLREILDPVNGMALR